MKQNSFTLLLRTKVKIHHFFLLIGMIFGIYWAILIPPFQAPDEFVHFYRAFEISEGHMISKQIDGNIGNYLPATIKDFEDILDANNIPAHPEKKVDDKDLEKAKTLYLSEERVFFNFPSSAIYSPIPYIPQALAIYITKGLNFSIFNILLTTRLFNLFSFLLLTYCAIKIIPRLKLVLFLLALMPMTVQQIASISGDSLLFGVSFLMIAYICKFAFSDESSQYTKKHFFILTTLSIMAALSKQAYFLFFLMVFLIPIKQYKNKKSFWKYNCITSLLTLLSFTLWMLFANRSQTPTDPVEQLKIILLHPFVYFKQLIGTFIYNDTIYPQFFGVLGWGDTPLPLIISFLITIFFTIAITSEKPLDKESKDVYFRGFFLFLFFLIEVATIVTMLFLAWPQTSPSFVAGIQGRYFIPIFMIFAYSIFLLKPVIKKIYNYTFYILIVILTLILSSHYLIIRFYP